MIQFFFSLQATMLFPLGPTLANELHFSVARLGYLNAAFLIAACVTGLIGAMMLDSVDRRRAIAVAVAGVAISAVLTSIAHDLSGLIAARLLSGVFGGPLIALSLAVISDAIPPEGRGSALGAVSRGSALALVAGVPLSLALAEVLGWRLALAAVGTLGGFFAVATLHLLPPRLLPLQPLRTHELLNDFRSILFRRSTATAMLYNAFNSAIVLVLAANIAAFLTGNLGFSESSLKYIWGFGGVCALGGTWLFGWSGDRLGPIMALIILFGGSVASYVLLFIAPWLPIPFIASFALYSAVGSGRVVVTNLVLSQIPSPEERGRFFSIVSAAAQAATAAAMFAVSHVLIAGPGNRLANAETLGWGAAAMALGTTVLGMGLAGPRWQRIMAFRIREQGA